MSIYRRLSNLFFRSKVEREIDAELRAHLEMRTEDNFAAGMSAEAARRDARIRFGNTVAVKERVTAADAALTLDSIGRDVRYALRQLRKAPSFTIICLLTLALGIGANTAVFSILQAVLLRPLDYHDPNQLVLLCDPQDPADGGILYKDFEVWKQHSRTLADMAIYYRDSGWSRVTLTHSREPEDVQGAFVSANFFPLLGVAPLLGRTFTPEENGRRERVVLLSYDLWQKRFGGTPDVVGQKLWIDGTPSEIIGVMPASFQLPASDSQFWVPITTNRHWGDPALMTTHTRGFYARWQAIGRLKRDVSEQQAQAEFNVIHSSLEHADPDRNRGSGTKVLPLRVQVAGNTRLALYILLSAVALLLLIACSNVANLILARGVSRSNELALRTALGATRGRIVQQLLTESLVLGIASGLIGLAIGYLGIRTLISLGPPDLPRLGEAGLNPGVLGFTFATALLSVALFGLAPILSVWRSDPIEHLKSRGQAHSHSIGIRNTRSVLIIVEFSLSMVLLTCAGLLLHSFLLIKAVDPGFDAERVLSMSVAVPSGRSSQQTTEFYDIVASRLDDVPRVKAVGAIDGLFDLGATGDLGLRSIEGRAPEPRDQWTALTWDTVRDDYFQALGVPLIRGRYFSEEDGPDTPLVAIIDESMARRYWKSEDPIGRRFKGQDRRGANDDWVTVIGVVRDIRTHGLEREPTPHVYEWYRQSGNPTPDFVMRTAGNPRAMASTIRAVLRMAAPTAILSNVTTVQQQLSGQLAPRYFQTSLLGLFSLLALVLAMVGIYGVMHYAVTQRTHEIGIRMALGAQRRNIVNTILRQGLAMACGGLALGIALDWAATRLLSRLLFGVMPFDPVTLLSVTLLLFGVAFLASLLPALRGASIDPMQALHSE
jgi:putative ABC transport system permease protein